MQKIKLGIARPEGIANISTVIRESHNNKMVFEVTTTAEEKNHMPIGETPFQPAGTTEHDGLIWVMYTQSRNSKDHPCCSRVN